MKPAMVARSAASHASLRAAARNERSFSSANKDLAPEGLVAGTGCKLSSAIVALRTVRSPVGLAPVGDILADATGAIDRLARQTRARASRRSRDVAPSRLYSPSTLCAEDCLGASRRECRARELRKLVGRRRSRASRPPAPA